jgi:serine/threonine protein kinase
MQVVAGLIPLHAKHILYGDLKLENVVLNSGTVRDGVPVVPVVRLIDFGLACEVGPLGMVLADAIGTVGYIAPEVVRGETVTTQADVWSFGMMVYNMAVCGMMCDQAASKSETLALQLAAAAQTHTYIRLSPVMAQLVQDCVAEDPAARPTAVQLARRLAEYSRLLQIKLEDKLADDAFRSVVPGRAP